MRTISVSPELKKLVEDKVLESLLILQSKLNRTDLPIPPVGFRQMGRSAGRVCYSYTGDKCFNFELWINPDYFYNGGQNHLINVTVPHEVAHIVSVFVHGRLDGQGHGTRWGTMMYRLGLPAERCHEMSYEGVKQKKVVRWFYNCSCRKDMLVSTTVHNRIQKGRSYSCNHCRQNVVWTGFNTTNRLISVT